MTKNIINETARRRPGGILTQVIIQVVVVINFGRISEAQIYSPAFKSVEMQATIAPLGEMVTGNFFERNSVAALCKVEKAIYFFEPDSMENLILTNVVSLPDTPVAIAKGREVVLDTSDHNKHFDKLVVLMSNHSVVMVLFGKDGRPIVSQPLPVDAYTTDIRTADLEADGKLDIITFGKLCLGVSVAMNSGNDEFQGTRLMQGSLGGIPFSGIEFADFNGDLVPDMAALDWVNHKLLIFYGRGDGTFAQPVSFPLRAEPSTLAVADLTGNGYPDIIIGYSRLDQIDLYGGDGFGRFYPRQTLKTDGPISRFAIADFTGNGNESIVAFSSKSKEFSFFSYNVISKKFEYAGTIGTGENYDYVVPFYFPGRFRADLVAASLSEKYIKVFKTLVTFNKSPDIILPVGENPVLMRVFGNDTSNYVVVGDSAGKASLVHYHGTNVMDVDTVDEFQTEGRPSSMELIDSEKPHLILSYQNADLVSIYDLLSDNKDANKVMTPYLPFAISAIAGRDSAIVASAYMMKPDSEIGFSYFKTFSKANGDFIEDDYSVDEMKDYLSSLITIKDPSFFRTWRSGYDTLIFAFTRLKDGKSISTTLQGVDAKLMLSRGNPLLLIEDRDTLTSYNVSIEKPMHLSLHQTCVIPFDSADFRSVSMSIADSVNFIAFFDSTESTVSLIGATSFQTKMSRSWHVLNRPEAIAILPMMREIYFLNRSEAYVSIHNF